MADDNKTSQKSLAFKDKMKNFFSRKRRASPTEDNQESKASSNEAELKEKLVIDEISQQNAQMVVNQATKDPPATSVPAAAHTSNHGGVIGSAGNSNYDIDNNARINRAIQRPNINNGNDNRETKEFETQHLNFQNQLNNGTDDRMNRRSQTTYNTEGEVNFHNQQNNGTDGRMNRRSQTTYYTEEEVNFHNQQNNRRGAAHRNKKHKKMPSKPRWKEELNLGSELVRFTVSCGGVLWLYYHVLFNTLEAIKEWKMGFGFKFLVGVGFAFVSVTLLLTLLLFLIKWTIRNYTPTLLTKLQGGQGGQGETEDDNKENNSSTARELSESSGDELCNIV